MILLYKLVLKKVSFEKASLLILLDMMSDHLTFFQEYLLFI